MEYPFDLLTSVFRGAAAPEESAALQAWIGESEANRSVYEQAKRMWHELGFADGELTEDKRVAWEMLLSGIRPVDGAEASSLRRQIIRMALIVLALFAIAWIASVALSSGRSQTHTARVRGEQLVLPDGTRLCLDSGTVVRYSRRFGRGNRSLNLSGEAVVASPGREGKPLTVRTTRGSVVLNGATADVAVRPGALEAISIAGPLVYERRGRRIDVASRMMLLENEGSDPVVVPADANLTAWRSGQIVLVDEPFGRLVRPVEKLLGKKIVFSTSVDLTRRTTIRLNASPASAVADTIARRLNQSYRIDGNKLIFY